MDRPEYNMGAVEQAAREKNGWKVIAVCKQRHAEGTVPHGFIAFINTNQYGRGELAICGTAMWGYSEAVGIHFSHGHYDLRRDDAMADFAERAGAVGVPA